MGQEDALATLEAEEKKRSRVMAKMNEIKLKHRSSLTLADWQRYTLAAGAAASVEQ